MAVRSDMRWVRIPMTIGKTIAKESSLYQTTVVNYEVGHSGICCKTLRSVMQPMGFDSPRHGKDRNRAQW